MRPRSETILQVTEEGAFVVDTRDARCFAMNRTGLIVWKSLADEQSIDELIQNVERQFGKAERSVVREDIRSFIEHLISRDLLV